MKGRRRRAAQHVYVSHVKPVLWLSLVLVEQAKQERARAQAAMIKHKRRTIKDHDKWGPSHGGRRMNMDISYLEVRTAGTASMQRISMPFPATCPKRIPCSVGPPVTVASSGCLVVVEGS